MPLESGELWWVSPFTDEQGRPLRTIHKLRNGAFYFIRYERGIQIVADRHCRRAWITWAEGSTDEELGILLWGSVMGILLRLRGMVCLHASAVAIDGAAVAFVGHSDAGKSTTAAAFSRAGHGVLADDLVTLDDRHGGEYRVHRGYSHLRLCPDATAALYGRVDALPQLVPSWDKRRLDLEAAGPSEAFLPLRAIYLLGERCPRGARPVCSSVSPREALMGLVTHTYSNTVLDQPMRKQEFEFLTRLVGRLPIRRLTPGDDLGALSEMRAAVLDDVRGLEIGARRQAVSL